MAATTIRWAQPGDVPEIIRLWKLLAQYERHHPEVVSVSPAQVKRDGFGAERHFECLLVERRGRVVGLATFIRDYATWTGQHGMFVHDLIREEEARGDRRGRGPGLRTGRIPDRRRWGHARSDRRLGGLRSGPHCA